MIDQYGSDQSRIIQDLIRRVEKLEANQRSGPGLQIGQATSAFTIPSTGYPGSPDSGASLYVSGSELRFVDSSGTDKPVGGDLEPFATAPAYPASFSSPATVSGTVLDVHYNALRADVVNQLFNLFRAFLVQGYTEGWWPDPTP